MSELLAALLIAAVGLLGGGDRARPAEAPAARPGTRAVGVPRILCRRPAGLELRRFEDRSAQLLCGGRILARIAVPG